MPRPIALVPVNRKSPPAVTGGQGDAVTDPIRRYPLRTRILHWLVAILIFSMLFIGFCDGVLAWGRIRRWSAST